MKWLEFFTSDHTKKFRLICCHHGGGAASYFCNWKKMLGADIELGAIQLPGREGRIKELPLENMRDVVHEVLAEFSRLPYKPFILFGHSLGALICYELSKMLEGLSLPAPKHLIVSGCRAPHILSKRTPIRKLPDHEFIKELKKYNGVPQVIWEEGQELLKLFLPIWRADFTISETYEYSEGKPLSCNITALHGKEDSTVNEKDVKEWEKHTFSEFKYLSIPGDHFFIKSSEKDVLNVINDALARHSSI